MQKNAQFFLIAIMCLSAVPGIKAEFIVSSAEGSKSPTRPFDAIANIGVGFYSVDSALVTKQPEGVSIKTDFIAKNKPFAALVGEFTIQPHERSFINIVGGAGFFRKQPCRFINRIQEEGCFRRKISCSNNLFDGNLFDTNLTLGMTYHLAESVEGEAALGYGFSYGDLTINNGMRFTYYTVGPLLSIGATYTRKKWRYTATYTVSPGAYKELDRMSDPDSPLLLRFPKTITNHVDLIGQYEFKSGATVGACFSYDLFQNIGPGTAQSLCAHRSTKSYRPIYDVLQTILILGFVSWSF